MKYLLPSCNPKFKLAINTTHQNIEMRTCAMRFNLRNKFSLKTLLALMLVFTYFNLIHTKDFYEITLYDTRIQSQESESSYNDSRHYGVLNKYEEYVEESNPAEAKKFYASNHGDYSASLKLRDTLKTYGFYQLDKYKNIHNVEITRFGIFKDETLLLRKCNWFALSFYSYDYEQDKAKEYCSDDYIKVADDPVLSKAIKQELAEEESSAKSNQETDQKIALNEAILRFLELFLASLTISLAGSFLKKRYWPAT